MIKLWKKTLAVTVVQEAMSRPEMQQQMQQMQAAMQNQQLQKRMAELRNDPEMKGALVDPCAQAVQHKRHRNEVYQFCGQGACWAP